MLIYLSATCFADDHGGKGIGTAIEHHNINIQRHENEPPDKNIPKGLLHSRDVLESIRAGQRPSRPDIARPERPETPAVAMRPELPDMAMRHGRPETPNRPDRPNKGRH